MTLFDFNLDSDEKSDYLLEFYISFAFRCSQSYNASEEMAEFVGE